AETFKVVADANRYFASEEPWTKRKTDFSRMATVLGVTAEVLRVVAIMAQPAMPGAMAKLLDVLAQPELARDFAHATPEHSLGEGTPLPAPAPIFPRYVEQDEKKA
ncbi:MAG: methionine--tRNA ligase, partial [Rhodoblastus sp.]|nr:methionine--tRNA ligase [Rhodoblastus sp.]